jgi:hypothetical protein
MADLLEEMTRVAAQLRVRTTDPAWIGPPPGTETDTDPARCVRDGYQLAMRHAAEMVEQVLADHGQPGG